MTFHKAFGKILAPLKAGTRSRRTYHLDMSSAGVSTKSICYSMYKRILRSYNKHIDGIVYGKILEFLRFSYANGYILATITGPSIAGSDEKFVTKCALCNFPGQCMFATARTQQ